MSYFYHPHFQQGANFIFLAREKEVRMGQVRIYENLPLSLYKMKKKMILRKLLMVVLSIAILIEAKNYAQIKDVLMRLV